MTELNATAIVITSIICLTLIAIVLISERNDKR